MLARGDSTGVFQFESSGMREALRQVKPTEFEDLIALVALYRPGPMAYIPTYAARKHGREQVAFLDPRLEEITGTTYAICIYQEQYMEIAKHLAGFTPAEAETLRKAIGKKIHSLMASLKDKFLEGCAGNDVSPGVAQQLWKDMESSQDYSFNKAHAACYALIAYRTAWLKANHPHEYMAALISSVMNTKDRVPFYVNACREMGIEVEPPDVNSSRQDFAVVEGKIRFGLNAVKNVGEAAADAIVRAREEGGPFASLWEFTERADPQVVNKRALESLVKCGALDSTGATRLGMLAVLDHALAYGSKQAADRLAGQASIFDGGPEEDDAPRSTILRSPRASSTSASCCGSRRRRSGSTSPSTRSSARVPSSAGRPTARSPTSSAAGTARSSTVGGIVSGLKQVTTKRGEPMVFVLLDDPTGSAEVVVFNSTYAAAREYLEADRILVVKGRVDHKQAGETKLIAMEVKPFEAVAVRTEVRLRIDARDAPAGIIRELAALVRDFPGEAPVYVALETSLGERTLALGPEYRVKPDADFFAEARALLGEAALRPRPRSARADPERGWQPLRGAAVVLGRGGLTSRVVVEALTDAREHLERDPRHRLDDPPEGAVRQHEHADGRRRRDRRRARHVGEEGDLAEPVPVSELGDLLPVLRNARRPLDEDEELPARGALPRQHVSVP